MPADPFTPAELETAAAAVHQAYLDTCARLGWPVEPANQVPYDQLSEESKELDRASVRAVAPLVAARVREDAFAHAAEVVAAERLVDDTGTAADIGYNQGIDDALDAIARAHRTTPTTEESS